MNEYWNDFFIKQKLSLKDIVDKRQVGLYGRSFKKLNVIDGSPVLEVCDPQDILVDRYADPTDIDTGRFLIHTHIYRSLQEIKDSGKYDEKVVAEMKDYYNTTEGIIKATDNFNSKSAQVERMQEMGVPDKIGRAHV